MSGISIAGVPIVQLSNVEKTYSLGRTQVDALRGVNLEVARGEFLAILGPSGSGKSTLLNIIGGIDRPSGGEVIVAGRSLNDLNESQLATFRKSTIGFVFQLFNLIPSFSALENVMLPLELARLSHREAVSRAWDLLEEVDLGDRVDHVPAELSIGEQQRVAVARAIANDPPIVLADEPTGNLDQITGEHILHLLEQIHTTRKTTMIVVSHSSNVTADADRAIQLVDGKFERK